MFIFTAVALSLLAFAAAIPGSVDSLNNGCYQPLWTVVGNHYAPREVCQPSLLNFNEAEALRRKYFKEFSEGQDNPDEEEINRILDKLMSLLPTYNPKSLVNDLKCTTCKAGIESYRFLTKTVMSKEQILKLLKNMCIDFHIMTPQICLGSLKLYGEALMEIVDSTNNSAASICTVMLNLKCGGTLPETNWNVDLPDTKKPPITKPKPLPADSPRLKVLHISDTHWDTQYAEGSWAECPLPLCCRKENKLPNKDASKAGKFGGWRCDTPEAAFDSMLDHLVKQHPDLDYIIWTGDIPAHDIWEQTMTSNLDVLNKTVAKLSKAFPKIPIYPSIGNHESIPGNLFYTGKEGDTVNPMDWLFKVVDDQWSRWLSKNTSKTIRLGAFYTTLIRPGFRIVSMNLNYCYKMNWWLIKDNKDPLEELKWFANLLQEAENKKEKVHVIGHIPAGSNECLKVWQTNYYNILNRYENTVTAQFFGHTHSDEFEVFYDMKDTKRPFGVAYIGPSLTTYMYHNPSYRIYYVEGDHKDTNRFVIDHESWYFELEKANLQNKAEWKKLYSAKKAYNMSTLFPEDWNNLYQKIKTNDQTLDLYHKFYWNDSPKRPKCDENCRRKRLCDIRSCEQYGQP